MTPPAKTTPAKKPTPKEPTVPYTLALPDGKTLFIAIPESMTRRDRDGTVLLKPAAARKLDQARAFAMKTPTTPSPAFIRTVRETLGLTQEKFAAKIGYSTVTIKRWEAGSLKPGKPARDKLHRLIKRLSEKGLILAA